MPHQATKGDKHTLIEQGTEFKGTMKSTCPVVVNGRVEGELSAPELDVTATGTVQGNIKAERLSSRGMLSGNIDAGDLFLSGSVGNKTVIKAKNLEVKLAPEQGRMELTIGECTLDVGDEPSKERRIDSPVKAASALSGAAHQLPVTRSVPPLSLGLSEDKPTSTIVNGGALDMKENGALAKEPVENGKSGKDRPSRPPPPKKAGARDSVPPGA